MVEESTIKIKYHDQTMPELKMEDYGDWVDLYCAEDTEIKKGERAYVSQGVSMKLPEGYEAIMAPRSSTFKNWGLLQTNGVGIIDSTFCGDADVWQFPALATRDILIPKHTRICQFRIQRKQPKLIFETVSELGESRGGLGSSGI